MDSHLWKDMIESRGRLLLAGNRREARIDRLVYLSSCLVMWIGAVVAILLLWDLGWRQPFEGNLFLGLAAIALIALGVHLFIWARKIQAPDMYERGVDNFHAPPLKWTFKSFDDIEIAKVIEKNDSISIAFWQSRKHPWGGSPFPLVVKKEDLDRGQIRDIIGFLESKGVKVSLTGKAERLLRKRG